MKRMLLGGLAGLASLGLGMALAGHASAQTPACYVEKYDLNHDAKLDRSDYFIAETMFEDEDIRVDFDGSGDLVKLNDLGPMAKHFVSCVFNGSSSAAAGAGLTAMSELAASGPAAAAPMVLPPPTGGPDSFGYTYQDSSITGCPTAYTTLAGVPGVQVQPPSDDTNTTTNIGFNFPYYGVVATQATVSNNGHVGVGPAASGFTNSCAWGPLAPPIIAPFWDDLYLAGATRYGSFAACPGGRESPCFAAEWENKDHFAGTGGPYTFEVFLFPSGKIEMQILTINPTTGTTNGSTGIRNTGAGQALAYGTCNTDYFSPLPRAIYFLPPGITTCLPAGDTGPGVDPDRQLGRQVHLPILNFQGQDDVCRTWIEVQNIGPDYAKAVLITWGEPGFCPPQCAGPLKVECTGLLQPGSTWNLLGAQIPTGSKGGMLFKFSSKQISDLFPGNGGDDDIVADAMCEDLFFGVVGDCDDYRRFKKAYNEGLDWGPRGLNMGIAQGKGSLAVDVLRHCPGDVTPGVEVSSKYNGIAGTHLGAFDPVYGGYGFYVPLLYADKAGFNSIMYIQNGGLECSSIEIWFKAQDDCLRARICEIFTLAPGETYQWDASDCVGPDWQGSAWLRSTQPLGIVVDIIGRDVLMSYMGEPAAYEYFGNPDLPDSDPASKDRIFNEGDHVLFGPLMYSEYQGWDTGVQVQNLSPVVNAKVKVYFLDRSGDIITTLVDWVCPRGSQTFFLPVIADLPGNWVGSIRVESQEWWTPGSPAVDAPSVVAVATLIKYNDAARTTTTEAIAYNLLPEHKIYIWQIGSGAGGTFSGVGLVAIPSLIKDLDGTGVTSEVAIANIVPKPGFTDFAVFIYDQNGVLDYFCQKLNEKQVEYINLQTWGYINPGFKGSAIISAVFWEHDVFDPVGGFQRNLVGLGAVSVERSGTRLGEDVPGDEAAGERGIAFGVGTGFTFWGPNAPNCPGIGRIPQP